jgi:hypothetical protein
MSRYIADEETFETIKNEVYLNIFNFCSLTYVSFSLAVLSISDYSEDRWFVNGTLHADGSDYQWFACVTRDKEVMGKYNVLVRRLRVFR